MALETNEAIEEVNDKLEEKWSSLYTGQYFQEPIVSFERNEIESLLRHLTVAFTPGHDDVKVGRAGTPHHLD